MALNGEFYSDFYWRNRVALRLDDKKAVVEEVSAIAATAHSAVAAEYRGLTVEQLTQLRKTARASGEEYTRPESG